MDKINMFIAPIVAKKRKHSFFAWVKLKLLIRKLNKISPDFDMLMEICEFLNLLKIIYMYGNDEKHHLFLSTIPKGYDGSMIYMESNFSIKIILKKSTKEISIEIMRKLKKTSEKEIITFQDGQYEIKDVYDEQKFIFIIACIMGGTIDLVKYYYSNKKL